MKKIQIHIYFCLASCVLFLLNSVSTVAQTSIDQFAETIQEGILNQVIVQQISEQPQFAWVLQSGEMEDELTGAITPGGEENLAEVDQSYSGNGNRSFLHQFGSFNQSFQKQNGNENSFNLAGNFPAVFSILTDLPSETVPTQDGDYHWLSQIANGNKNQAWIYQAGRDHDASQLLNGDENQVWTSQSGFTQSSEMIINGNRNGSHYLQHEEGKFPHSDEEEGGEASPGGQGNGNSGNSGGSSDEGGMPEVIPPPHDEDHVFVPTVGVAIKQMGSNSIAEMYVEGDDNKAVITQRGGAGTNENGNGNGNCEGGHYVNQDIYGDWNRIFADQRGTGHYIDEYINGNHNLAVLMQKGNGSISELDLMGSFNEVGVDQKGKNNISDIDLLGNFNGNFTMEDEFGIKVVQEGRGNNSDIDIIGDSNFISVHQGGGAISMITQTGNYNSSIVDQSTLDEH